MKTLNDYLIMNYRMEIVEDKDEGGFVKRFEWTNTLNDKI